MIYVNCAMSADAVKDLLVNTEGDIQFEFVEKKGIKMSFNVNTDDLDAAVRCAKDIIKSSDVGKVLYFQVTK